MSLLPDKAILLQSQLEGKEGWLLFSNPVSKVSVDDLCEVTACLDTLREYSAKGYYIAGYVSYDAASGFDAAKQVFKSKASKSSDWPLLSFGIYEAPEVVDLADYEDQLEGSHYWCPSWKPDITKQQYCSEIRAIKEQISAGNTYQTNYTFRMHSDFSGDSFAYFLSLYKAQVPNYAAYLIDQGKAVCSVSPELFFQLKSGTVTAKPMKGTSPRGKTSALDLQQAYQLNASKKNQAENLMIVDMMRNDLGQIALSGTVKADKLLSVETYPTLLQMTSLVTAETEVDAFEVLKQCFPCASVTGAPKVSTMSIIADSEYSNRGLYTGSIGFVAPDGDAQFNVAIRTVLIDEDRKYASYGTGSGIIADSDPDSEYDECLLKTEVLYRGQAEFSLLETCRLNADGNIWLLEEHLRRLQASSRYFGFSFDELALRKNIKQACSTGNGKLSRLRVLLHRSGLSECFLSPMPGIEGSRVMLSEGRFETKSDFIAHKTTHRNAYQTILDSHDADDVIIVNQEGYVTESCIANLVIKLNGEWLTPHSRCGLLNGVFRQYLLNAEEVKEAVFTRDEVLAADKVYLINALRGWISLDATDARGSFVVRKELGCSRLVE